MIKFKHEVDRLLFPYLSSPLIRAVGEMATYCEEKGLDLVITETISNVARDKARNIHRVSRSHETGRAVDVRIKKWPKDFIDNFCDWFNIRLQNIAALTHGGQRIICVRKHNHIHVQVHSMYACRWTKKQKEELKVLLENSSSRSQHKRTQDNKIDIPLAPDL